MAEATSGNKVDWLVPAFLEVPGAEGFGDGRSTGTTVVDLTDGWESVGSANQSGLRWMDDGWVRACRVLNVDDGVELWLNQGFVSDLVDALRGENSSFSEMRGNLEESHM